MTLENQQNYWVLTLEKVYYRSRGPHLAMPENLRDAAVSNLFAHGLAETAPAQLISLGLTARQAALSAELIKLVFVFLTLNDAKIGSDQPDGTLDNCCMSPGENAYEVLEQLGLIKIDGIRMANWTSRGVEIVRMFKNEIEQLIQDIYNPETAKFYGEKIRISLLTQKMTLMNLPFFD